MFVREKSILIDAPAEDIYDYVVDLNRHPEWAAQPMRMTAKGEGAAHSVVDFSGLAIQAEVRIVDMHRPSRLAYESSDFNGHYRWTFDLQQANHGTRVTHRVERLSGPLPVRLIQPWLMWPLLGGPGCVKGLANLKRRLEEGASNSDSSVGR